MLWYLAQASVSSDSRYVIAHEHSLQFILSINSDFSGQSYYNKKRDYTETFGVNLSPSPWTIAQMQCISLADHLLPLKVARGQTCACESCIPLVGRGVHACVYGWCPSRAALRARPPCGQHPESWRTTPNPGGPGEQVGMASAAPDITRVTKAGKHYSVHLSTYQVQWDNKFCVKLRSKYWDKTTLGLMN